MTYPCFPTRSVSVKAFSNSKMRKLWKQAYVRYNFNRNKASQKIQASLFTDYFIQAISVGNIGTDKMCSHNGIEPRNIYIQKNGG